MKIAHIVNIFAFVVLLVATASVSVAIWAAKQSDFHNYRISLAHKSYEQHLQLTADTYLLFKRFGDLLLVGDSDRVQDVNEITERLNMHLSGIRSTIEDEIRLVGDEELEELELLDEVEDVIEDLSSLFQRALAREDIDDIRSNWREFSLVLNDNIKNDFRELISVALEEEEEEVAETEAEARAQMELVRRIAFILAGVFLLITISTLVIFRREFTRPFEDLLNGVRKFAAGDFSTKIELKGRSELSEIGLVLDEMSEVVAARTKNLTMQNEELEQAVRQRTETLEKLLTEARKSEETRRQLLADVSHELRTPLTVIQGESDIALRGADKTIDEYKEALGRTRMAANHTANLVSDLLFISRKDSGSLRLSLEPVDLSRLIYDAITLSGLDVRFTPPSETTMIRADGQRLKQAMLALLENARHHGGSTIEVTLDTYPNSVEIAVSDDGPGISDEEKELAFERFFRGSNAASRYTEGLGLGLPIVRSIAEAHNGSASIHDRTTGGTTIMLTIPKTPQS
ncbi:sensor histidine kinase [Roseovarius aestuarii]|uniref:histidine kinase n=1 Tax=Roseovarius aestuarii TaxID=475083 RepID=A0A1X7BPM3_9RHOB|nr:HAMP domain-containing sensor histidine kinase [Roseovarius aestuarii]SMC11490.1 putative sensor histidine kinase TcrY [Roseovarius aestuarii]